jgi:hypothetical protein
MEMAKLITSVATPVVVFILGLLFLRKMEGIRQKVSQASEFDSKWASGFFEACSDFMRKTERYMALLWQLQSLEDKNDELGTRYQAELTSLHPEIQECELKIRRYVALAPRTGMLVDEGAIAIQGMLSDMVKKGGNFDDLFAKLKTLGTLARSAHAEMLNLDKGEPSLPLACTRVSTDDQIALQPRPDAYE